MVFLIDPNDVKIGKCPTKDDPCITFCATNCYIKPLYGIDPVPE